MATLQVTNAAADRQWWPDALDSNGAADIDTMSATSLTFTSKAGFHVILSGTGLNVTGGLAGTVTGLIVRSVDNVAELMTITGLTTPFADLYGRFFGEDGLGGADPFAALQLMLAAADHLIGSSINDVLGAFSPGDDVIDAGLGSDFVVTDGGDDVLDGGRGYDYLSSYTSFYLPASRGVRLDVAKGTMTDCWGGRDTVRGFEAYEGSIFPDVLKGSNTTRHDEDFWGLGGADTIDGRGGWDNVFYERDARYGGTHGIKADLTVGFVRDGWGEIDSVTNIEGVAGTAKRDVLLGNDMDNQFEGLDGVDSFDGRDGSDWLSFQFSDDWGAKHGVRVNLAHARVADDGFGNTETAASIENLFGSDLGDTLTGSSIPNAIYGHDGHDVLDGAGGNDLLDGGDGDDIVVGGTGDDWLAGGAGIDTLTYGHLDRSVHVNLMKKSPQSTGGAGKDKISGFEKLVGTIFEDTLIGTHRAETIDGDSRDDVIYGNGGADRLWAGDGDDIVHVRDLDFYDVFGNAGTDTLVLDGAGFVFDTRPPTTHRMLDVERIDITGSGSNSLIVDADAITLDLSPVNGAYRFWVLGDGDDTVSLGNPEWLKVGKSSEDHRSFDIWRLDDIAIYIQRSIEVLLLP